MMDDIAEQQDVAKEISEAISNPVAFSQVICQTSFNLLVIVLFQDYDEDDLLAELDDLGEELEFEEQEKLDQQMLNIGPAVRLPDLADLASWAKLGNVLLIKGAIKRRRLILRLPLYTQSSFFNDSVIKK